MRIFAPYYESIPVGSTGGGGIPALLSGYRYHNYSTPITEMLDLLGFSANFLNPGVRVNLTDVDERDIWTPFYSTQMTAIFGFFNQAEPVLYLPMPYKLMPLHRVLIELQNTTVSTISETVVTLVGTREIEVKDY